MDSFDHIACAELALAEGEDVSSLKDQLALAQIAQSHALVAIAQSLMESEYGVGMADTVRRVAEMR